MNRIIVYDGECSFCVRSAQLLARFGLVPQSALAPWDDLEGDEAQRTWDAGFRNEMAVLDRDTGEIRSGARGLMWALRESWLAPVAVLLDLPGVRSVTGALYRLVAYNRRVLAPPPRPGFVCACDPDEHRGYQWALILLLAAMCGVVGALLGGFAAVELELGTLRQGAMVWLLACLVGWSVPFLASRRLEPSLRMKYLGSLTITAFAGALIQIPAIVALPWLGRRGTIVALAIALAAGFAWTWRTFRRRIHLLGLSRSWIRLWAGSLLTAMLGTLGLITWMVARS